MKKRVLRAEIHGRREKEIEWDGMEAEPGVERFRAPHDQRFAAGPRQGHSVLDPRKMPAHFSVLFSRPVFR